MPDINFSDAQQALAFLQPQLYRINTEIDMMEYQPFDYSRLVNVNTDGDMFDVGSVFYSGDVAGAVSWISERGFDVPRADIATSQHLQQNHMAAIGYEWSRAELVRASRTGRNLENEKAAGARLVAESFVYGVACRGHTEKNMTGLFNDPVVPSALVPADGTAGATTFASKTPAQINRDVNAALNAPFNATKETHRANVLAIATTRLQYMASTTLSAGSDTTILAFVKANNSYTLETGQELTIIGAQELETAGAGGTARMMAYERSPRVVQLHLPGPHEFLDPFQRSSMTWEVDGIMNVGGIEFRRPLAAAYRDGV